MPVPASLEDVEHLALDRFDAGDVDAGDLDDDVLGDPGAHELEHRVEHVEVGAVAGLATAARRVAEEAGVAQALDERRIEAGADGELVEGVSGAGVTPEDASIVPATSRSARMAASEKRRSCSSLMRSRRTRWSAP